MIADYDPAIAPSEIAAIWHSSWAANNPELAEAAPLAPLAERAARELETGRWQVRVARLGGRLVGFAATVPSDSLLDQLFVLPDAQRHGVGTALLNDAKLRSPRGLKLRTQASNRDGLRFYARHGFLECGREMHATLNVEMIWLCWLSP
ncbi:MAG: acyl-CoA N-acyltransferase [Rhodospirillales bacterium]|nr:acyl-CoA N-acyltransferase [Rhodospirillales bacterium]